MALTRRELLSGLGQGALAVGFTTLLGSRASRALASRDPKGPFKRCVVLWMEGGPSQLDTFDPKQGGPRQAVATSIPGVQFAETLSGLAEKADELCMIRSVGSREGEHARATELMHTGFSPLPSFPRPAIGSMVSSECEDHGSPRYVVLGGIGFGPAFLGTEHGPFVIQDLEAARTQLGRVMQKRQALDLLTAFNSRYSESTQSVASTRRTSSINSVRRLLDTPFPEALNLELADQAAGHRYGDHTFGRRVLVARRLLQLGVPFVEVQLSGWDTHIDNQRRTEELCRRLQKPWLALMQDLQESNMWDDTLVVWMGEFGRTPRLNGRAGRDHFPEATPVVLAGGNLGGNVIGQTSDDGSQRVGEKHRVADLVATLLTLVGVDTSATYTTDFGSPTSVTDDGTPIEEIIRAIG